MEIITQTAIAVPREIDERVITAAIRYNDPLMSSVIAESGKIAIINQGETPPCA